MQNRKMTIPDRNTNGTVRVKAPVFWFDSLLCPQAPKGFRIYVRKLAEELQVDKRFSSSSLQQAITEERHNEWFSLIVPAPNYCK
jgi:hypothetical protein